MNVLIPTIYGEKFDAPMPVLYMLDGGMNEDVLHIAGLVQVLVCNGSMRPFMLVGIENTQRRRDMTGPTTSDEDRKIAPVVGGSAEFRRFIKEELTPEVRSRYRATDETAIIGESLAGLFVMETFVLDPDLFTMYIAIDPSLWWNNEGLLKSAEPRLAARRQSDSSVHRKAVLLASSNEPSMTDLTTRAVGVFESQQAHRYVFLHLPFSAESHATIYHPAALAAFRTLFAPPPEVTK